MITSLQFLRRYVRPHTKLFFILAGVLLLAIALKVVTPILTGRFIDRALAGSEMRDLIAIAIAALLFSVGSQLLDVLETALAEQLSWNATNALRLDLAEHVLNLDYQFHTGVTPGELIERVDGDASQLAKFFSRFIVNIVSNVLLILLIISILMASDWRIGAGVTAITALAFLGAPMIRKRASPAWQAERQTTAETYGFLSEYLEGLEDIRAGGPAARTHVELSFLALLQRWYRRTMRAQMWGYALMSTTNGIFSLALTFSLGMGGYLVRSDALTLGGLFAVIRLVTLLREPMTRLRDEVQDLQQSAASLSRVQNLLAEQPRIVDGPGGELPDGPLSVEWRDVSFAYQSGPPVLRNVSLNVEAGKILGIVGRTGSGKSTLTRFIPRYLDPDQGAVFVGGQDVRNLKLADLRSRIGVVSQDAMLLNASLRDNLTLFAPIDRAHDEGLVTELHLFGLGDWFDALPDGLDTELGPGTGVGLSAGEAQLVCCVRIALLDPAIILLDEASARLDPVSERTLHAALGKLIEGRTAIIIAHRLDTLAFADEIAVIQNGEVLESGPRDVLALDSDSHFSALLRLDRQEVLG